jgi:hypothetical protein
LPPSSLPLSPLPTPLKVISRGFLVSFHIGIWNPSTIYHHLNLLSSSSPLSLVPPPHILCLIIVLVFIFNIWVEFRQVSQCMPTVAVLYFFNPLEYSPLPLYLLPLPVFNIFQYTFLYPLPSHLVVCDITVALSFSFSFSLSSSSIE